MVKVQCLYCSHGFGNLSSTTNVLESGNATIVTAENYSLIPPVATAGMHVHKANTFSANRTKAARAAAFAKLRSRKAKL